ncbi:MAG TPA: hypothetical protein VJX67_10845 [Blastocatellia bacterium]|nr:hypothetical protein [Blastocatellia bacterium]
MRKVYVGVLMLVLGCCGCSTSVSRSAAGQPYPERQFENYQDLYDRGAPTDDFSETTFNLTSDNTIEIHCYTKGRPGDEKLVEPSIKKLEYLTEKLRKQYKVRVIYYDGNPNLTVNDQQQGTGAVLRTVELPSL